MDSYRYLLYYIILSMINHNKKKNKGVWNRIFIFFVYFVDNINRISKMYVMSEYIKFLRKIKEVYVKSLRKSWNQILLKLPHNLFYINQIKFLKKGGFR